MTAVEGDVDIIEDLSLTLKLNENSESKGLLNSSSHTKAETD
jgi:hypothetical protein